MKSNVQKIHEATMRILERTGVKFHHPDAVKILKEHNIRMDGDVAYFTEDEIMYWIHKAPAVIDLFAADEKYNVMLGGCHCETATSSGSPQVCDENGKKRNATMEDYVKLTKIYEMNPNYKINGGIIVFPSDTPIDSTALLMHYMAYTHSNKTLMTGTGSYDEMEALMQMGIADAGSRDEFEKYPRLLTIINVNTPLQLDKKMTETLLTFVKYRQPVVIASAAMAGTSSPITLAGTIALQNAEVLSTVALAQMTAPGAPVIYGSQSTTADPRNGSIAIGSPEGALCYNYCAQLAKYYELPSRAGGALSDAKVVNAQAGYESMMTYLACRQSGVNLIVHGAGILDSYTCVSFEKVMMDFEVMEYVNRYLMDIEVDEESIPEELIDELGHEAGYLLSEHTLDHCHSEPFIPSLAVRGASMDPKGQYEENIKKQMDRLLDKYEKPQKDAAVLEKMRKILLERGVGEDLLNTIEAM